MNAPESIRGLVGWALTAGTPVTICLVLWQAWLLRAWRSGTLGRCKPIDELTPDDLAAFPIWEFTSDAEGVEGQDEAWVRPLRATVVPEDAWALSVAADFRTASGALFPGVVGVTTAGGVELSHGAILAPDEYVFVGSGDLFDGPSVAAALELAPSEAIPLVFTLRALIGNEKVRRTGTFG